MRIDEKTRALIRQKSKKLFGEKTKTYLFGSRTDDDKKGGDIDLFIEPETTQYIFDKKFELLADLKIALGDQKIDIVFAEDSARIIEKNARKDAILL